MPMTVYFDNSSTTRVCPEAADAVVRAMTESYGNPSNTHARGREAKRILEEARTQVADALGCDPAEIYFTSGGTESDNWALMAGWQLMRHRGKRIVSTAIEHDAVRNTLKKLERDGAQVVTLMPDAAGRVSADALTEALTEDTVLVSVMLVNNETGAVNDIAAMTAEVRKRCPNALFHTDAVQGLLKIPFTPKGLGADLISVSSHKIHGPKGAGALYIRKGLRLPAILSGGGQENQRRPGTEPLPAIAGFGAAAAAGKAAFADSADGMRRLRAYTAEKISEALPDAVITGEGDAPHILNLSLPGYRSEVLLNFLDAEGIAVSKGSACRKGARSHVLEAMGLPMPVIDGAIRVSFCRYNTAEECDYFIEKLTAAAKTIRHR